VKVLITGVAGLTASLVARELSGRRHEIVGVARHAPSSGLLPDDVNVVVGDCRDPRLMEPLLAGAAVLIHIAGIHLAPSIASLANLTKPATVIVISTANVDSTHLDSAALYRAGEVAIRARRPDAIIVRPTMVYGSERDRNVHKVIEFAARYRFLPFPTGATGLIQPVHFVDLAAAIVALLEGPRGVTVPVGAAEPIPLRAAVSAMFSALGVGERIMPVPYAPAHAVAKLFDRFLTRRASEMLERTRDDRVADNTTLSRLTAIAPRTFPVGVRDEVRLMRASGAIR
jgi:uncharacterized protein YbjT (DUF2867 family)